MRTETLDLIDCIDQKHRQTDAVCAGIGAMIEAGAADELIIQLAELASDLTKEAATATQVLWARTSNVEQIPRPVEKP